MAKSKPEAMLSVFKGREAKLNRAVFQALATKGQQTVYDIHKQIRKQRGLKYTRYASVNKRMRSLEESSYVKRAGSRKTKAGFEAAIYELTTKTYLAILINSIELEDLLTQLDEVSHDVFLADLILGVGSRPASPHTSRSSFAGSKSSSFSRPASG